ncbi:kinesin-like protein KIN-7F [Impatiens glandulifera]|uniref:kinesin-like protein KIN-7F n=1 Tax=Impatiens glandulifera TaxID=253017 RepID=UPI001FB141A2|nr:kinesin-like protein KIN-7F [Impatiens glandulifera]
MGSTSGNELTQSSSKRFNAKEENIFVSIRLRPLSAKEIAVNDVSEWECINNNSIINLTEKSLSPQAYTFDRVFGPDCSSKQVYHEGAKEVVLSAVKGINATIFAYGQTGSGKTYTMFSITEYTIADVFDYIDKHKEWKFELKFSAMEIYNESVRDLLILDGTNLRLLDDPEKGTVVEKLSEETLRDWNHFKELLSICEAQRHIGGTALNEVSSRSHQIIRLTIESSSRQCSHVVDSSKLTASVNFVDLAGSERASQTLAAGSRLKEGSHINRSLLTLGTVIRKLSNGGNGHVPYRDSKLTRILQNSLGGNARTAIICTMSPAGSHVEQSRNALLFASRAKEVSTNARVNLVMSDKELVKKLQGALSRMENELRTLGSMAATENSGALLKEKELVIKNMENEIEELRCQRDNAQSRFQELLQTVETQTSTPKVVGYHHNATGQESPNAWLDDYAASGTWKEIVQFDDADNLFHLDDQDIQFLEQCNDDQFQYNGTNSDIVFNGEDYVQHIEKEKSSISMSSEAKAEEGNLSHIIETGPSYEALKLKVLELQKTIQTLVDPYPVELSPYPLETGTSSSRSLMLARSRSCSAVMPMPMFSPWVDKGANGKSNLPYYLEKNYQGSSEGGHHQTRSYGQIYHADIDKFGGNGSQNSFDDAPADKSNVHGGNMVGECESSEALDEIVYSYNQHMPGNELVIETRSKANRSDKHTQESLNKLDQSPEHPTSWPNEFEKQQREIIELWDACFAPLTHRSQFFLLFKGDPSDSVYMEVELRRLTYLKSALSQGTKITVDGNVLSSALSKTALSRERRMLSKLMLRRFSAKQRQALYHEFEVGLNTKHRRRQLSLRLWTYTKDLNHVKRSASIVAELSGCLAPKEMLGLSLSSLPPRGRSFNLKHGISSLYK